MFILDKLNLADLRLLFLAVNFKVNLVESLRRKIFEYTSSFKMYFFLTFKRIEVKNYQC